MSLFGGDSSAPPTDSELDSELDSPRSIERSTLQKPPSAQGPHSGLDLQEEVDHDLDGDDADSEESDEEQRPNRFKGPPQTWRGYTAADRQIAESLQQAEDTDIAAHLYNAHSLKRRVRKPASELTTLKNWQSKDAWLKQGKDLQYTDAAGQLQTELVPAKDWTAWPVPPESLYTLAHGFRRAAVAPERDEWVIGGGGTQDPGEELRDELLGLFLRLAKENWNAKDQEGGSGRTTQRAPSRSRSRSHSVHTDAEMKDASGDELESGDDEARGKRRGRKPRVELDIKPAILADDAKAQRLLRPTINSMLAKLDDVALALQRTRQNHFGRGVDGASSQSEFTTDAETTEAETHSRRPCRARSGLQSKRTTRQSSRQSSRPSSRTRSHPKPAPAPVPVPHTDSDSASDYAANLSPPAHLKRRRSLSSTSSASAAQPRDHSRAGLLDWSEALHAASLANWDSAALHRTAQRCSILFGESMPLPLTNTSTTTTTTPTAATNTTPPTRQKRPYFQPGTLRCPHADCYGHARDFAMPYRVVEHCVRRHGYDPRTNDSDNEERTCGGVHMDGFLMPVGAKKGWLGRGRKKG